MTTRVQRIFLVRHAESEGNVDKTVHARMPDHAIGLSPTGLQQADSVGIVLADWVEKNGYHGGQIRFWNSPYKRTRQTVDALVKRFGESLKTNWIITDRAENILLCEQQFGLFDGIPDEELPVRFPNEHAHYKKCEDFEGRFWARFPSGESRFDVCQRVHQFFGTIQRDAERHGVEDVVIVAHGVTNRAIRTMWMHHNWEWFEAEKNPNNCSISLIELDKVTQKYVDRGYIFDGFKTEKP